MYIYTHTLVVGRARACTILRLCISTLKQRSVALLRRRSNNPQHLASSLVFHTVCFHNFNLRIFNLRVSNPNKFIVDAFVDTMSDFNVPVSRPKKTR